MSIYFVENIFFRYPINDTLTNQCGIYKFNRRVAELETGYSCDKIESLLKKFEEHGKVTVSRTTIEIMLVNWFKHNFKVNKKKLLSINTELKDVKDKELLKRLYDFCSKRQYPTDEINEAEEVLITDDCQEGDTVDGTAIISWSFSDT